MVIENKSGYRSDHFYHKEKEGGCMEGRSPNEEGGTSAKEL